MMQGACHMYPASEFRAYEPWCYKGIKLCKNLPTQYHLCTKMLIRKTRGRVHRIFRALAHTLKNWEFDSSFCQNFRGYGGAPSSHNTPDRHPTFIWYVLFVCDENWEELRAQNEKQSVPDRLPAGRTDRHTKSNIPLARESRYWCGIRADNRVHWCAKHEIHRISS